jgi:hypothetical protein
MRAPAVFKSPALNTGTLVLALAAALTIAFGAVAAAVPFNALIVAALAVIAPLALWLVADLRRAVLLLVLVIAILPRFASPVSIGFKPTALDIALLAVLVVWLARQVGASGPSAYPLRRSAISIPVLLLIVVAIATFIVGIPNGALTTLVLRRFAELVLSLLAVLVLSSIFRELDMRSHAVRAALIFGGISAAIGIALYVIPDALAIRLLSALRPFDYPTGDSVLRFIRDDPALQQRATGLWIDPNAFGGYLLMTGALCLPQLFSKHPVAPRWLVLICIALLALCLVLTVSRAAMLGFAAAAGLMAVLRYRQLIVLGGILAGVAVLLPQTRELIGHFIDGFLGNDLATQMRFGEYKDAFRLIERYPLLGVGFTGSPDVDLYVGVSSMYLLIMQQMGALGILAFTAVILALFAGAVRAWPVVRRDDAHTATFLGAHGAIAGMLLSGIFDHYFLNVDFHNSVIWVCFILGLASATTAQLTDPRTGQTAERVPRTTDVSNWRQAGK